MMSYAKVVIRATGRRLEKVRTLNNKSKDSDRGTRQISCFKIYKVYARKIKAYPKNK